jgi:hypothetical protein
MDCVSEFDPTPITENFASDYIYDDNCPSKCRKINYFGYGSYCAPQLI